MDGFTFFFVLVGISCTVSWVFRIIEKIEEGGRYGRKRNSW